ncbi:hypothetical protein [Oceaniglobus ichthyenteri]|nr:hypothetical protein [Oceaniglobus ichthyenteri]
MIGSGLDSVLLAAFVGVATGGAIFASTLTRRIRVPIADEPQR